MYTVEEERIIDNLTKAFENAQDPECKRMWDHKLRCLLKETLQDLDK